MRPLPHSHPCTTHVAPQLYTTVTPHNTRFKTAAVAPCCDCKVLHVWVPLFIGSADWCGQQWSAAVCHAVHNSYYWRDLYVLVTDALVCGSTAKFAAAGSTTMALAQPDQVGHSAAHSTMLSVGCVYCSVSCRASLLKDVARLASIGVMWLTIPPSLSLPVLVAADLVVVTSLSPDDSSTVGPFKG